MRVTATGAWPTFITMPASSCCRSTLPCASPSAKPATFETKPRRHDSRRNSPSVTTCRPSFSCQRITSVIASPTDCWPASSAGGRRKLPMCSARNGGLVTLLDILVRIVRLFVPVRLLALGELHLLARRFLVRNLAEDVPDDVQPAAALVVGPGDVPGRIVRIGVLEHI